METKLTELSKQYDTLSSSLLDDSSKNVKKKCRIKIDLTVSENQLYQPMIMITVLRERLQLSMTTWRKEVFSNQNRTVSYVDHKF